MIYQIGVKCYRNPINYADMFLITSLKVGNKKVAVTEKLIRDEKE